MLDSEAVFKARMRELGVSEAHIQALAGNEVNTLGRLAFLTSLQPGTAANDAPFVEALVKSLGLASENDLKPGELSSFRRLWVEASTVAISEIRARVDKTDDTAPKKVPVPERASKRAIQQSKLSGIKIEGNLEPSHALIDLCQSMKEDDTLIILEPYRCTCRSQELDGQKKEKFIKPDSSGSLKEVNVDVQLHADLSSEFRVRNALVRRSLALDQVGLAEFSIFESYHDFLYNLLTTEVPSSHICVNLEQILRADRLVWKRMAELTRDGINPTTVLTAGVPSKSYPLHSALDKACVDPVVLSALQPLAKPQSGRSSPYDNAVSHYQGKGSSGKQLQKFGKQSQRGGKPKGSGKGKGMGKGVPVELAGLRTSTSKGNRYCFSFNLASGCSFAKPGDHCKVGFHGCMKCGASDHGFQSCSKRGSE